MILIWIYLCIFVLFYGGTTFSIAAVTLIYTGEKMAGALIALFLALPTLGLGSYAIYFAGTL